MKSIGKTAGATILALLLLAGIASAQTTTPGVTTTPGTTTTTPAVPNTGAGGDATANVLVLGTSALIALGGAAYLTRRIGVR